MGLRDLRDDSALSQQGLAMRAWVSKATIARIEAGSRPHPSTVPQIGRSARPARSSGHASSAADDGSGAMTATAEAVTSRATASWRTAAPAVLAVMQPKGGVSRYCHGDLFVGDLLQACLPVEHA